MPREHVSARIKSTSNDHRRVNIQTEEFRSALGGDSVDSATQDLRTLQAVDDIGSFSYMLGDELPIFPDEENTASEGGSIRVTMKAKRSENSVSNLFILLARTYPE